MNLALLLSGGTGSRIHSEVPKQYIYICGKRIVTYALEALLNSPLIDAVEIVAECGWREAILEDAEKAGLDTRKFLGFAVPGANRQCSILNGLRDFLLWRAGKTSLEDTDDADMEETDTVLIHDAARPLLDRKLIEDCYRQLAGHDGVMPVLPMKDTIYLSRNGLVAEGLVERSHIYAGQAPELFLLKKYYRANLALLPDRIMEISGSAQPAVMAGMDVAMIPGDENNFKITTEADIRRFQEYMERKKGRQHESMETAWSRGPAF